MRKYFLLLLPLLCACSSNNNGKNCETPVATNDEEIAVVADEPENEVDSFENETVQMAEAVAEEDDGYILIPGETYYVSNSWHEGDQQINMTVELIAYKDETFSGSCYGDSKYEYSTFDPTEFKYPIEGEWEEISKHDKRFMLVNFELGETGQEYTLYIDENQNVYMGNLNSEPVKLQKK